VNAIFVEIVAAVLLAGIAVGLSFWLVSRSEAALFAMLFASPFLWFSVLLFVMFSGLALAVLNIFGFVLIVSVGTVCAMAAIAARTSRKQALLEVLSLSVEKHMPLPALASAYARDEAGAYGHRLRHWAELLRLGTPLTIAVERSRGVLPKEAVMGARIGQVAGDLAAGLRAAQFKRLIEEPMWHSAVGRLLYLGWLTLALLPTVAAFLAIRIGPSLVKVLKDFRVPLPWLSRQFMSLFTSPVAATAIVTFAVCGCGLMVILTLHYVGGLPDGFPGLAWLSRRLDAAVILRALALSAQQKRPLGPMLSALADSYPKRSVREKLQHAQSDVEQGQPWFASLQRHGLISAADAGLLAAAERLGNLPWALHEIADSNERRLSYQLTAAVQLMMPIAVVAVGTVVGAFMITYFLPLTELITSLSR